MIKKINEFSSIFQSKGWLNSIDKLRNTMGNPLFAYLTIFLLQFHRIWNAWIYRDLTYGDTSSYFTSAYGWASEYVVNYVWSPLYTVYYGTLYKIMGDVYLATLLHRFMIVFAITFMVLAILRRLLPADIAWLVAAWWVVIPINFDALYEVHLFAMLLPLISVLFVLYRPNIWTRGIALGILILQMLLVRNEIVITFSLWVVICLAWEFRQHRLGQGYSFRIYLIAYGIPVLVAALVLGLFYSRNTFTITPEFVRRKHTLNVCQIYAFGYQQRYSDWTQSPWTECQNLMLRDFGKPEPTMMEAVKANPGSMVEHFMWNIGLLPAGIQVALFNSTSQQVSPDYAFVLLNDKAVLIPSIFALGLFVFGMTQLYRKRSYWWDEMLKDRVWGWILLASFSAVMLIVVPMQRPRPSYMFMFTFFLMAVLGMCLSIAIHYFSIQKRFSRLVSILMIGLPLFVPAYYSAGERPLLTVYNKLALSEEFIGLPGTGLITNGFSGELCNYFAKSFRGGCVGYGYEVFSGLNDEETISEVLGHQSVPITALLMDDVFMGNYGGLKSVKAFLEDPEQEGWKLVYLQENSTGTWRLYVNVLEINRIAPELNISLSSK